MLKIGSSERMGTRSKFIVKVRTKDISAGCNDSKHVVRQWLRLLTMGFAQVGCWHGSQEKKVSSALFGYLIDEPIQLVQQLPPTVIFLILAHPNPTNAVKYKQKRDLRCKSAVQMGRFFV